MFTRRFVATLAGTTLTAATLGLTALGMAATAGASSVDNAFLAQLESDGITPPTPARAISDGHAVCTALQQGQSPDQVVAAVADATGLTKKGAHTFAVDAASAYCPQFVTSS